MTTFQHIAAAADEAAAEKPKTKHPPNPLPCGCGAVGVMDLKSFEATVRYKNIHVRFCPLHGAAPKLLRALKSINVRVGRACDEVSDQTFAGRDARRVFGQVSRQARAAIAKATVTGSGEEA